MVNNSYPRPSNPLVNQNRFRHRKRVTAPIPTFETVRDRLPVPVLPQQPAWERIYRRAWQQVWKNLYLPAPGSGLITAYNNPEPGGHLFMWDTAFMSLLGMVGRRAFPFIDMLNNFYAGQHMDGFIGREIDPQTGRELFAPFDPDGTGPNILAWAEWQHFRATGDEERLRNVFYPLMAYYRWLRAHRTWRDGLYWATGRSSGMDDQNRIPHGRHHHQHWAWVDATLMAAVNALALQRISLVLEEKELQEELSNDRAVLRQRINELLWRKDTHFYHDIDTDGRANPNKTIGAFWAMQDRTLLPADNRPGFVQHLRDRDTFYTAHRVPTLSVDSPQYAPDGYWRGDVWSPLNYMVIRGLRIMNEHPLAHEIAVDHLDFVTRIFDRTGSFWKNYAGQDAIPGPFAAPDHVGWAALSPITILFEGVLGITADWPQRRVFWDKRLAGAEYYGVQNYPLGPNGHTIDLLGDDETVTVTTDQPFTLILRTPEMSLQTAVAAGTTEIPLS